MTSSKRSAADILAQLPRNWSPALALSPTARMRRTEVQHFADGGFVRRITDRLYGNVPPPPAPSAPPAAPVAAATPAPAPPPTAAGVMGTLSDYAGGGATDRRMKAAGLKHGGMVKGPGTGTSDSIPAMLSHGEVVMPADTVRKVGAAKLLATIDATHEPTGKVPLKGGVQAKADGGLTDPNDVTRVGNSYSGGNVSGNITVNGQAPGGTVSTAGAPPAASPAPAAPAATSLSPTTPAAAPVNPTSASAQLANLQASNASVQRGGATLLGSVGPQTAAERFAAPVVGSAPATPGAAAPAAPASGAGSPLSFLRPPRPVAAPAPAAQPPAPYLAPGSPYLTPRQAFADGGVVEDPRKKLAADAAAQLAAYAPQPVMAVAADPAGGTVPVMQSQDPTPAAPVVAAAPVRNGIISSAQAGTLPAEAPAASNQVRASQIPVGGSGMPASDAEMRAANPQAPAQPVAAIPAPAAPPVVAPAGAPLVTPAGPSAQTRMATLPAGVTRDGNSYSGGSAPAPAAAPVRENPLGSRADTMAQLATLQASNAAVPVGGATLIDGAGADADRRAQFNEQANLRNAVNQTSWSPRRGTQGNDAAVAAAMAPINARAVMAQTTAKEAGDTQRAGIQERGAGARARLADTRAAANTAIDQQRLGLEGKKVTLDANRDDRAQASAEVEQAQKARMARLQDLVVSGTPVQQKMAAGQLAALQGKGFDETGKVGEVSTAIRKEFESLPEVKNYKQALPSYKGIEDAVKRNTPMSDINIVYGIAKLYDPNSVVREGEYSTVANAPGIPERVKGWVSYVAGGGKLTDEVKRQILTEGQSRMETFENEYGGARSRYSDIASRSGADATLVVPQNHQPAFQREQTQGAKPAPTPEAYAALPVGSTYVAPDGSTRRKSK